MFGKTGQVASEVRRHAGKHEIIVLDRTAADLMSPTSCAKIVLDCDADLVLNAAAYTSVDQAETEPEKATCINASSPGAIARAAKQRGLPFLHISTDYVFDGSAARPWQASDRPNPQNVYGHSKLLAEIAITECAAQAVILRTSWVFSAHGNNFVKTMLRLGRERDELSVVDDQIGGPTAASDIAQTLLNIAEQMCADSSKRGIYHYSGAPDVSWKRFASEIFALSNSNICLKGIPTSAYATTARRPLNSRLDCAPICVDFGIQRPNWKSSLANVLRELGVST